jgi:hypothetical protein
MKNYFALIPIILMGWIIVFVRLVGSFGKFWFEQKTLIKVISISLIIQFIFAARQWFFYEINLTDITEIIFVSSKSNLYFILSTLLSLFLCFFSSKRITVFCLLLQVFQGIIFIFGEGNPSLVHVDFLLKSDYNFSQSYFIFAGMLIFNSILFLFLFI